MTSSVDVVILTWNDPPAMLESAVRSVLESGVDATVIVIDNGSQPAAVVEEPGVMVVRSPRNLGVSVGRTVGVLVGRSPHVAFLDSDAQLEPAALARLLEAVGEDRVGIVGPVYVGQHPDESAGRAPTLGTKVKRTLTRRTTYDPPPCAPSSDGLREVDFVIGACQVFRRELWDDIGGLDTSIFYGPEDVDFCLRAKQRGWTVLQVLDAHVRHEPRRSAKNIVSPQGARHAVALARHLWRHRGARGRVR